MQKIMKNKFGIGLAILLLAVSMTPSFTNAAEPTAVIVANDLRAPSVNVLGTCTAAALGSTVNVSLVTSAGTTLLGQTTTVNADGDFNVHVNVPSNLSGSVALRVDCATGATATTPPAVLGESIPVPVGGVAAGAGGNGLNLMLLYGLAAVTTGLVLRFKTNA